MTKTMREAKPGFTGLGCHPAADADPDTEYRSERLQELAAFCDARARRAAGELGIELCTIERVRLGAEGN